MKILYLITSTTRGGAENTLYNLLSRINRNEFTPVKVICLKPLGPVAENIRALGIEVESLNMGYLPNPAALARVKAEIKKYQPDIVHAFLYRAIQFARAAKTPDFKLIASPRVNYRTRSPLVLFYDRLGRDKDDLVISESDSSRNYMLTRQGYKPERVITIHNGVDAGLWHTDQTERRDVRFVADIKDDELLLFSSGRIDTQKGYEYLLRALALLRGKTPKLKTVIAGTGPLENKLFSLIDELKLSYSVRLVGEQKEIRPWLSAADMFVLPSLWEGVPNSLLEAMSAAKPCLATAVDGVLEAAKAGDEILTAPPADPAALAEKIFELYNNSELRARLAAAAERAAYERLGMGSMIENYETAYRDILKPADRGSK